MMNSFQKVKTLLIGFAGDLQQHQIPALRGAIIERVGRDSSNVLFSNHLEDTQVYQYPLIQYKSFHGKAAILGIGAAVTELDKIFEDPSNQVDLFTDGPVSLSVEQLKARQTRVQIWERKFKYRILNWLPLNQQMYTVYQETKGIAAQAALLERIMKGNILSFAKGIDWQVDKELQVTITEWRPAFRKVVKGVKRLSFTLDFEVNVSLPEYIGLGKNTSFGYGTIIKLRDRYAANEDNMDEGD